MNNLRRLIISSAFAFAGFSATSASALTLPACDPTIPTGNCLEFGDFNVYSLPLLNLQAGLGPTPGPGSPYYFPSTFGQIQNFTIIGINNGQETETGNPTGQVDGAYNTPSPNNTTNVSFSTLTTTDPGTNDDFVGDAAGSWDARVTSLLQLVDGTPLVGFFAFNETGSGTGLLTTDLLVWAMVTLYTDAGTAGPTFYLGGDTGGVAPGIDAASLPAPDGSDANGSGAGAPLGYGPWVYVHAGICADDAGNFFGFPNTDGECTMGGEVREQNNLGQNAAAFMINSPELDAALNSGDWTVLSITWQMAYINGGGETAWFQPVDGERTVSEPGTVALLGLALAALAFRRRRVRR